MITEEEVLAKIRNVYSVLMQYRGQYQKQKPFRDELAQYLQSAYEENADLLVGLFWKDFEGILAQSDIPNFSNVPYCVELFSAITNSPSSQGIKLACQLMIHSNRSYQEDSARFLYEARDPVAVPYLIEGLNSDDYGVVRESALALGNIGDDRAEPYLVELITKYDNNATYSEDRLDDVYPIIRASAFTALCLLNSVGARKKILESIFIDRDKSIQQRAIRHLIMEMPDEAMPYMEELITTQPDTISHLVSSAPGSSITFLEKLLEHEDSEIALLAKKYLGEAKQRQQELIELTIISMNNIVSSMPQEAIPYLERLSVHPDKEIAALARKYLRDMRS